jgi:hypothetical protein
MKNLNRAFANFLSLCLLWGGASIWAYAAAEGSFERTLNVTGAVDLDVVSGSGNIAVRTGSSSTVHVRGLIRARDDWKLKAEDKVRYLESNPPIEQSGNVIRIGRIENRDYSQNVSINYELDVPADTRLKAKSGSGNVTAGGLNGSLDLSTGSGNVKASGVGGELHAESGSGNIDIDSLRAGAQVHTGSGNIQALGIGGAVKAKTGSGNVRVEQSASGDVDAETGSGEIILSGVRGSLRAHTGSGGIDAGGDPSGMWSLHAGSGNVKVRLKPDAAFDLNAHTSSGRVTLDHPVTVTGTISPKDLKGKVRGGGPLIEVTTGSGDVHIQ